MYGKRKTPFAHLSRKVFRVDRSLTAMTNPVKAISDPGSGGARTGRSSPGDGLFGRRFDPPDRLAYAPERCDSASCAG
jgi:hypothetical protein